MRGRLTLAFVVLAVLLAGAGGLVQGQALHDLSRTAEVNRLSANARLVALFVEHLQDDGLPVTSERLAAQVPDETRLTVTSGSASPITVSGSGFDEDAIDDVPRVQVMVGATTIEMVGESSVVSDLARPKQLALLVLVLILIMLAGVLGFLVAGTLSRPFHQLARSAAALGRGRFDFEPPRSKVPEVVSIATSLQTSAQQLQESLQRDRDFFHHASHVLRTPLTGLRLELEELSARDDLSDDVRRSAARSLGEAERLECTVTELLDFARARRLVSGAEVSLVTLGSDVAQHWRDKLPESREVRAFVDAGADVTLTPGPVEQLLDSVLRDVSDNATGAVTLRFVGQEEHVKVTVSSGPRKAGSAQRPAAGATETIAEVLGGRCTGDAAAGGLEILLPRR